MAGGGPRPSEARGGGEGVSRGRPYPSAMLATVLFPAEAVWKASLLSFALFTLTARELEECEDAFKGRSDSMACGSSVGMGGRPRETDADRG